MLSRYLILLGEEDGWLNRVAGAAGNALGFEVQFCAKSVRLLLARGQEVRALPQASGFVLGSLFAKHGPPRAISPDDVTELDQIRAGELDGLLRRYWGSYVACFAASGEVTVLRDPSAGLPCYYLALERGYAVASDVDLFVRAGLLKPSIDWDKITRYLAAKDLPSERTALCGVSELLAGLSLHYRHGQFAIREAWSPWNHVDPTDAGDPELAEVLRRTIRNCVAGWASELKSPLLMLSGGLDSSVVAAAMTDSTDPVSMTIKTRDVHGDERIYARAMANAIGSDLLEEEYQLADIDLSRSVVAHLPKPCGTAHELALHAAILRCCAAVEADGVLTGNGGDNVFYKTSSVRPFYDRLFTQRSLIGASQTLLDIARVNSVTLGAALRATLSFAPRSRARYRWEGETSLLTATAAHEAVALRLDHRWLSAPSNNLPGKRGHVALLLRMQSHIEGYLRPFDMPVINPLTAQPILELALTIPTWRQIEGGRDRAVVRRAFEADLPQLVTERRNKGSPGGFAMAVISERADEVVARLVEGELVARGFVDRDAVIQAVARGPGAGLTFMRLLSLLDVEAWIRHWQDLSPAEGSW